MSDVKTVISTVSEASESQKPSEAKEAQKSSESKESLEKPKKGYSKNGKKIGRPKKKDVQKKKNSGKVGRPRGDNYAIEEYKARMLNSPRSQKVLDAVFEAASDPDHKNFTAAAKLVLDRIMPVSAFEKGVKGSGRASVQITINGIDGQQTVIGAGEDEEDVIDGDFEPVSD